MQGLIETIRKLGLVRVAILFAAAIGVLGAFAVLEFQGSAVPRMVVLATDLDPQSTRRITDALEQARLPYRVDPATNQILVADGSLQDASALLSKAGINPSGTTGYEIFDTTSNMMLTDFDQQIRLTRALEGELARTIQSVRGINKARVHIVLPHREPFEHQRSEAQASVMLTLAGRGTLSSEAIQSVVNLVAAGVPGLRARNVTVVDSNLHLLVQAGDGDEARTRSDRLEDIRQKNEAKLAQAVELMLERSLGIGHVHAEASIRMNFDKVNETQERFDPDSSAVRSTQAVTTNNRTTEKLGNVSLQNNLPNADASAGSTGSTEAKQEETTNYEVTKTVRALVHDQPQVERITLAVMVDGTDEVGADGKHTWKPREQADLDRIDKLVKSAIGFDERRGDRVDIVSMPFTSTIEVADAAPPAVPAVRNGELMSFIQIVAFGVVGLIVIVLTARSIYAGLAKPPGAIVMENDAAAKGELGLALDPPGAASVAQGTSDQAVLAGETDNILDNIETRIKQSSLQKVRELAEKYPEETVAILRAWLEEDKALND